MSISPHVASANSIEQIAMQTTVTDAIVGIAESLLILRRVKVASKVVALKMSATESGLRPPDELTICAMISQCVARDI